MGGTTPLSPEDIRTRFSRAMSKMYQEEVPAYAVLVDLVVQTNAEAVRRNPALAQALDSTHSLRRISEERHGAIRVGTAAELGMLRRLFAVMGMFPVGYYDLSAAGLPVHSTAFRPVEEIALKENPFRMFASLLRLDLVADVRLRADAEAALAARDIFTPAVRALIEKAECSGGIAEADADCFIREALEIFRWHDRALVPEELYFRLDQAHRLLADVVSFRGPHINHLTPRVLDIDRVQVLMAARGIVPKDSIEGPPLRRCPILLRQTSFKALEEEIAFQAADGQWLSRRHTARFGEIEQRGVALTPAGRALYDRCLSEAQVRQRQDSFTGAEQILSETFAAFPDSYEELREQRLAYFEYVFVGLGGQLGRPVRSIDELVRLGLVTFHPVIYEDFLPVSAAGIFHSNLGGDAGHTIAAVPDREAFEAALGAPVLDEFELYEAMEKTSIQRCLQAVGLAPEAA